MVMHSSTRQAGLRLFAASRARLPSPGLLAAPARLLNLQEFQSKDLMDRHGITVQKFRVAQSVQEAKEISETFKVSEYVIKAQILAGGRGKGTFSNGYRGGVKLTRDPAEVPAIVGKMLGQRLVTKQTPSDGVLVSKVMVAHALDIARETYLAILMDRDSGGPVVVGSPFGGVDIEEVSEKNPDAIFKEYVDISTGMQQEQADRLAANLGFRGAQQAAASAQILRLYRLFIAVDCTQVEINPFAETPDGQVVCFDAKLNFDDNAAFRQRDIFALDDTSESDPREVAAARHSLNYIGMDGNIGCLVNGAGLAMATMDIVKLYGGEPANFLDVGGGVTEQQVHRAFEILTSDEQVECILVNIFGGIVNCATVAAGIANACRSIDLRVPMVVRLEGTNVDNAKRILAESGLPIVAASTLDDAAEKAVSNLRR